MEKQGKLCLPKTAYIHDDFESRSVQSTSASNESLRPRTRQIPSHLLFDIERTHIPENVAPPKIRRPIFNTRTSSIPFSIPPLRRSATGHSSRKTVTRLPPRSLTDSKLNQMSSPFRLDALLESNSKRPGSVDSSLHADQDEAGLRQSSYIPATFKKLPHLMTKADDDQKVLLALSSLQDHGYISRSPDHSKALTLSRRGYVECHKGGLTELTDVATLEMHMQKFSMVRKHTVVHRFTEFKYLRKWDHALRRRKFHDKQKWLQNLMVQSKQEYWQCAQKVMAECVKTEDELRHPFWTVPPFGLTLETISHELERRCDAITDALEATRSKISEILSEFFESVISEVKVSRLKKIYQLNRMHNPAAASRLASKDVENICRLYCLCEHILCQTAIKLHNEELSSLSQLFSGDRQGILQIEAFMRINDAKIVPMKLPFSAPDQILASDAAQIILIPDGPFVYDMLSRAMNAIFNSIANCMEPRIVQSLDDFLPPEYLAISFKADYTHCLPNSFDYITSHSTLKNAITKSDLLSLDHCRSCLDHIKPIFAYVEAFSSTQAGRSVDGSREHVDAYPQNAEQYILWRETVVKLPGQESEVCAFRLKYRRFKSYLQEKLQHEVIDVSFKQYYSYASEKLTDLKTTGVKYLRHLEEEISTYQQLVTSLPFIYELEGKVDKYIDDIQAATQMREILQKHYLDTTSGVDGTAKFVLPALNPHLADQMRNHYAEAVARINERHSQHIDIIQAVHSDFLQRFKLFENQLRGSALRNITTNVPDVKKQLSSLRDDFREFEKKAMEISKIMDLVKLKLMDMDQLSEAQSVLFMLDEVWSEIEVWKEFSTRIMQSPITDLQNSSSEKLFYGICVSVKAVISKHEGAELIGGLKAQLVEFERQWPIIQKLMDPKMKKSHFDALLNSKRGSISVTHNRDPQIDLSHLSIHDLAKRGVLDDPGRLSNIYALAVKEEAMFGMSERLQKSVDNLCISLRIEEEIIWLDGFDTALTQINDHGEALQWLQDSGFAGMVASELADIEIKNIEAKELLIKLQKCATFWSRNRLLLKIRYPTELNMKDSFILDTAYTKWMRCLKLLLNFVPSEYQGHANASLLLSKLDQASKQKIQDALDAWEKTTLSWISCVQQIRDDFPRLYLLNDVDALEVGSYFVCPGPDIPCHILSACFSNAQSFAFSANRSPLEVIGSKGEFLELSERVEDSNLSRLQTAQLQIQNNILSQILASARQLDDVSISTEGIKSSLLSGVAQTVLIGLQLIWSAEVTNGGFRTSGKVSARLRSIVESILDASIDGIRNQNSKMADLYSNEQTRVMFKPRDEWKRSSPQCNLDVQNFKGKSLIRARFQALILLSQQWRDFLNGDSDTLIGIPFYEHCGHQIIVRVGPLSYPYNCEFLDVINSVPILPQTKKYMLYLLGCLCSESCGIIFGPKGCGKSNGARLASQICGSFFIVCDFMNRDLLDGLQSVIYGSVLSGSWLCIQSPESVMEEQCINRIAKWIAESYRKLYEFSLCKINKRKELRPPVFFISEGDIFSTIPLPSHLQEGTRSFQVAQIDAKVIIETLLISRGIGAATTITKFLKAASMLQLSLPYGEAVKCLNTNLLIRVCDQIAEQVSEYSEKINNQSLQEADPLMDKGLIDGAISSVVACAFLEHLQNQLCQKSYDTCETIIKYIFEYSRPDTNKRSEGYSEMVNRIRSALVSKVFNTNLHFVERCMQLSQIIARTRRITIVTGPPQSGKSACIQISRLAKIIDLTGSAKDFIPNTLIKNFHMDAFYPSLTCSEFWSYMQYFSHQNLLGLGLVFDDIWVVVDCEDIGASDVLIQHIVKRNNYADSCSIMDVRHPRLFLEACSMKDMHPALASSSNIVCMESSCVDWKSIVESWKISVASKMEDRDVLEINALVDNHIEDLIAYISQECLPIADVALCGLARTFCDILENQFFLGRTNALRRIGATKFCNSVFVFATVWSFGTIISLEKRKIFTEWFIDRISGCLGEDSRFGAELTLWDCVINEENMELRVISDQEFEIESRLQRQVAFAPSREICMYEYMFSVFKLQKRHMLFLGNRNFGKTFFLDLMERKMKHENKVSESKFILNKNTQLNQISRWILNVSEQITTAGLGRVTLFVDDIHLPTETRQIYGLLRYAIEHRGILDDKKYDNDRQVSRIYFIASSITDGTVLSKQRRLFGSFALIPMRSYSAQSRVKIATTTSDLGKLVPSNTVKAVFARLPYALSQVHDWVLDHLHPIKSDDVLLRWSLAHLLMNVKALSFVPWSDMDGPNLCFGYVWHDLMRVYSDRITNLQQIEEFRTGLKFKLTESVGRNHARTVNFASERQAFYVLLPTNNPSILIQSDTSDITWEFREISPGDLILKAREFIERGDSIHTKVMYIPGFARHLSHALYALRPSNRVQASILIGPRGCGKRSTVRVAAGICHHTVVVYQKGFNVRDLQSHLKRKNPILVVIHGSALNLDISVIQYVVKLLKGQNLEAFERAGLSNLRFAFCVETKSGLSQHLLGASLPVYFQDILDFCTVDWFEGWTDRAILELIESQYTKLSMNKVCPKPKNFIGAIFQVYVHMESSALDHLSDDISAVFPLPASIVDFMSVFVQSYESMSKDIESRIEQLKTALLAFESVKEYERTLLGKIETLEPLVNRVTETRVKCREDAARFERIAKRAKEIAESEMVVGLQDVLYGDAPGQDLQHEFQDSQVQLAAATDLIKGLKQEHFTQLETSRDHEDLQDLLFGSLAVCFGLSDLDYGILKGSVAGIPSRIYGMDLNKVTRERIYQLRPFISDPRFIPEKLFAINRAAGTLCHWVRCFERFARANEWIKPDSVSNEKQSLDRVRDLAKIRLTALEEVESSVLSSKKKRFAAMQEEASTRDQLAFARQQIDNCHTITAALTGTYTAWKMEIHELEKRQVTLEGDCLLFATAATYLGVFPFEKRQDIIVKLQQVLSNRDDSVELHHAFTPIDTREEFCLSSFMNAEYILKQWEKYGLLQDSCTRENIALALSTYKIPLLIDPLNIASKWLKAAFLDAVIVAAAEYDKCNDTSEKLKTVLKNAKEMERYVLFENCVDMLQGLFHVLVENPDLVPKKSDSFPGTSYRIFLLSSIRDSRVLAEVQNYHLFGIIDMLPDLEAVESVASDFTLCHFDPSSYSKKLSYTEKCWFYRQQINETEKSILECLQRVDIVAALKNGEMSIVLLCTDIVKGRESLQNLVVSSLSSMRILECYNGLTSLISRILSALIGPCSKIFGHDFSPHILHIIKCCSDNFDFDAEGCWSTSFKDQIEQLASTIVLSTCSYLRRICPPLRILTEFLICSCFHEDDYFAAPTVLANIAGLECEQNRTGFNCANLTRTNGPGELFPQLGWKCLNEIGPKISIDVEKISSSIQKILSRSGEIKLVDVSSNILYAIDLLELKPMQKIFVTCCLNPQYVLHALNQFSSRISVLLKSGTAVLEQAASGYSPLIFIPHKHSQPRNEALRQVLWHQLHKSDSQVSQEGNQLDVPCTDDVKEILTRKDSCGILIPIMELHEDYLLKKLASIRGKMNTAQETESLCYILMRKSSGEMLENGDIFFQVQNLGIEYLHFCTEVTHPRDIFSFIISNRWARGLDLNHRFFWRASLGICYFFSILSIQKSQGFPCDVLRIEQLKMSQVLQAARILEHFNSDCIDPVNITKDVIKTYFANVFVDAPLLSNYIMNGLVTANLFQSKKFTLLSCELEIPDNFLCTWNNIFQFANMLPEITLSSKASQVPRWSTVDSEIRMTFHRINCLANPSRFPESSTVELSALQHLINRVPSCSAQRDSVLYFQLWRSKCHLQDEQLLFLDHLFTEILIEEGIHYDTQVELVRSDVKQLCEGFQGNKIFTVKMFELWKCFNEEKTPLAWCKGVEYTENISKFLASLQDKSAFLSCMFQRSQESDYKSKTNTIGSTKFPLHLFSNPKKIFELFRLAHSLAFSIATEHISFCALPLQGSFGAGTVSNIPSLSPELGFLISDIQMCGVKFTQSADTIELAPRLADITAPQSFLIKSVCGSSLPFRSHMKAGKQYWIDLPLFSAIPSQNNPLTSASLVATLLVKSKFNPAKIQIQDCSICMFLGNETA